MRRKIELMPFLSDLTPSAIHPDAYWQLTPKEFDEFFEAARHAKNVDYVETIGLTPDVAYRMALTLLAVMPPAVPKKGKD